MIRQSSCLRVTLHHALNPGDDAVSSGLLVALVDEFCQRISAPSVNGRALAVLSDAEKIFDLPRDEVLDQHREPLAHASSTLVGLKPLLQSAKFAYFVDFGEKRWHQFHPLGNSRTPSEHNLGVPEFLYLNQDLSGSAVLVGAEGDLHDGVDVAAAVVFRMDDLAIMDYPAGPTF